VNASEAKGRMIRATAEGVEEILSLAEERELTHFLKKYILSYSLNNALTWKGRALCDLRVGKLALWLI